MAVASHRKADPVPTRDEAPWRQVRPTRPSGRVQVTAPAGGRGEKALDQGPGAQYGIVGKDPRIVEVVSFINKVAASKVTAVLLEGESGTGKDLVARAIHSASARTDKPFMEISCAAIPENLLESELVGYEQGAFTGANSRKIGLFELADGGTVFLDEISELRLDLQVKLLRLVETHRFKRVGGVEEIIVDARIIAATNRCLEDAMRQGLFREDLYYRLKVIPICLPPLRERPGDIPLLAEHFVSRLNTEFGKQVRGISDEACECLSRYPWPGNVRELRNVIERTIILRDNATDGDRILTGHLPAEIRNARRTSITTASSGGPPVSHRSAERARSVRERYDPNAAATSLQLTLDGIDLEGFERSLIRQSLELTGGNQVRAAKLLGLGRDALRYRMKKYGLFQAFTRSRAKSGNASGRQRSVPTRDSLNRGRTFASA